MCTQPIFFDLYIHRNTLILSLILSNILSLSAVCAMAVRNCLECQQHSHFKPSQYSARGQQAVQSLMGAAKSMPAQASSVIPPH